MVETVREVYDDIKSLNYVILSSKVREKLIKVEWPPFQNHARWKITYEDGTHIADELSGWWLSLRDARKAIEKWELTTKPTVGSRFKGKPVPVLKRKRVSKNGAGSSQ